MSQGTNSSKFQQGSLSGPSNLERSQYVSSHAWGSSNERIQKEQDYKYGLPLNNGAHGVPRQERKEELFRDQRPASMPHSSSIQPTQNAIDQRSKERSFEKGQEQNKQLEMTKDYFQFELNGNSHGSQNETQWTPPVQAQQPHGKKENASLAPWFLKEELNHRISTASPWKARVHEPVYLPKRPEPPPGLLNDLHEHQTTPAIRPFGSMVKAQRDSKNELKQVWMNSSSQFWKPNQTQAVSISIPRRPVPPFGLQHDNKEKQSGVISPFQSTTKDGKLLKNSKIQRNVRFQEEIPNDFSKTLGSSRNFLPKKKHRDSSWDLDAHQTEENEHSSSLLSKEVDYDLINQALNAGNIEPLSYSFLLNKEQKSPSAQKGSSSKSRINAEPMSFNEPNHDSEQKKPKMKRDRAISLDRMRPDSYISTSQFQYDYDKELDSLFQKDIERNKNEQNHQKAKKKNPDEPNLKEIINEVSSRVMTSIKRAHSTSAKLSNTAKMSQSVPITAILDFPILKKSSHSLLRPEESRTRAKMTHSSIPSNSDPYFSSEFHCGRNLGFVDPSPFKNRKVDIHQILLNVSQRREEVQRKNRII